MLDTWQEHRRILSELSRARKAGTEATLTLAEWLGILAHFNYQCAYCQSEPFKVMEHIIALKRGGGTTAMNVVPACSSCNALKDRKGSWRDRSRTAKAKESLHNFLATHGPFTPIPPPRLEKVYYAANEAHFEYLLSIGKKARMME